MTLLSGFNSFPLASGLNFFPLEINLFPLEWEEIDSRLKGLTNVITPVVEASKRGKGKARPGWTRHAMVEPGAAVAGTAKWREPVFFHSSGKKLKWREYA